MPLSLASLSQGDDDEVWWETSFEIPKGAVAVNFVVNCENAWDNNGGKDHKVRVTGGSLSGAGHVVESDDTSSIRESS
jgi:hypothetical protein